jgi:hypothetical protein
MAAAMLLALLLRNNLKIYNEKAAPIYGAAFFCPPGAKYLENASKKSTHFLLFFVTCLNKYSVMKQFFTLVGTILLLAVSAHAQSFKVEYDTLHITTDGYFFVLNGLTNYTTQDLTLKWNVVGSNFPPGVQGTTCICDNIVCHKDTTALYAGVTQISNYPPGYGTLYLRADLSGVPEGTYYFQLRFLSTATIPADVDTQTYIIHKAPLSVLPIKSVAGLTIFPNPASNKAAIEYELAGSQAIQLKVTDVTGRVVYRLDEEQSAGKHKLDIPTIGLNAGLYSVSLQTGQELLTRKLAIEK